MTGSVVSFSDPDVVPRPAFYWQGTRMPRHLPAALADALHEVAVALHEHPGRRVHIRFQGNKATAQEVVNLAYRCVAPLPRRTAMVLSEIDHVKGQRWLDQDRTVAEAARYIRAMVAF